MIPSEILVDIFSFLDRRSLELGVRLSSRAMNDIIQDRFAETPHHVINDLFINLNKRVVFLGEPRNAKPSCLWMSNGKAFLKVTFDAFCELWIKGTSGVPRYLKAQRICITRDASGCEVPPCKTALIIFHRMGRVWHNFPAASMLWYCDEDSIDPLFSHVTANDCSNLTIRLLTFHTYEYVRELACASEANSAAEWLHRLCSDKPNSSSQNEYQQLQNLNACTYDMLGLAQGNCEAQHKRNLLLRQYKMSNKSMGTYGVSDGMTHHNAMVSTLKSCGHAPTNMNTARYTRQGYLKRHAQNPAYISKQQRRRAPPLATPIAKNSKMQYQQNVSQSAEDRKPRQLRIYHANPSLAEPLINAMMKKFPSDNYQRQFRLFMEFGGTAAKRPQSQPLLRRILQNDRRGEVLIIEHQPDHSLQVFRQPLANSLNDIDSNSHHDFTQLVGTTKSSTSFSSEDTAKFDAATNNNYNCNNVDNKLASNSQDETFSPYFNTLVTKPRRRNSSITDFVNAGYDSAAFVIDGDYDVKDVERRKMHLPKRRR